MQWINYVLKGIALILGYSLRQTNSVEEIDADADARADAKFGRKHRWKRPQA